MSSLPTQTMFVPVWLRRNTGRKLAPTSLPA
jgi:hypothetical protein